MSTQRQRIKRVAVIMETVDERVFTIYSESPGAEVTMERHVQYSGEGYPWDLLGPPPSRSALDVTVSELSTWTVTAHRPEAQRDRLDAISNQLGTPSEHGEI